ncbi:MAG: hypothetical protein RL172_906 [Bacteroidota bacterium]|jgi:TfoX/Sxy family transcriptional regulator of competence genes
MAYNEKMADRIREIIAATHIITEEKKMFAGLCFMVDDKMCVGVQNNQVMIRLNPNLFDEVLEKPGCIPMEMTGRMMKGFVFVDEAALTSQKQLNYWVQLALEYNPYAKSSKKKTAKKK